MTSLLKQPLVRKAIAALAVKEVVERVQEARRPQKSFLRRNSGKIALVALVGAGAYIWQQQRSAQGLSSPFGGPPAGGREPAIEPDERLDTPLRAPEEALDSSPEPSPVTR